MRMFSLRTLGSTQHGGRKEIGILGIKSSVRQRSARSSPPRRRRVHNIIGFSLRMGCVWWILDQNGTWRQEILITFIRKTIAQNIGNCIVRWRPKCANQLCSVILPVHSLISCSDLLPYFLHKLLRNYRIKIYVFWWWSVYAFYAPCLVMYCLKVAARSYCQKTYATLYTLL